MKSFAYVSTAALVLLLAGGLCSSAQNAPVRVLDIKETVAVTGDQITLVDIVTSPDRLAAEERGLVVGPTPDQPRGERLSLVALAYRLQKFPGLLDTNLRGPNWITFKRIVDPAVANRAEQLIRAQLSKTAPWQKWRIRVTFSRDDEHKLAWDGKFEALEVLATDSRATLGPVALCVRFLDARKMLLSETTITPEIAREVQAVVMRDSYTRGHLLRKNDLQLATQWVGNAPRVYVTDLAACIGRELKRRLNVGAVVCATDLVEPLLARRGDVIWVTCSTGALAVRVAVSALASGRKGESVQVRNPTSNKVFKVELVGHREAVLSIGG